MAAALPPRTGLTPEQKEEVQKHIVATNAYLNALKEVPPPHQNPSTFMWGPPPPPQNSSQYVGTAWAEEQKRKRKQKDDYEYEIPPPPNPELVPPVVNGSGWHKQLPSQSTKRAERHWALIWAIPYIGLGLAMWIIASLING